MNLDALLTKIQAGQIDTVQLAAPDMLGRLVGKRFTGDFFNSHIVPDGTSHGCNYLFAVNMEMDPQDGYRLSNWDAGFGDFEMRPDFSATYPLPWEAGNALVFCDFHHHDGKLVEQGPRTVLRRQVERLAERGWKVNMASELEFYLYQETYDAAASRAYRDLTPSSLYRIDYHVLQPARDEPLFRDIRNLMLAAGIPIENSKGEWGKGQHEVNITYSDPITSADRHIVFKHGAKHLAYAHGKSISFMAKPYQGEAGSSCHIHLSLKDAEGRPVFWNEEEKGGTPLFRQFRGGLMKYSRELCYFFAPTVNAYKRYEALSWAPTRQAWATDNRTTGYRVVGEAGGFRIENRMPGADANPYLAFAAMIAAGLAGVDEGLDCGPEYQGNAYIDPNLEALPSTLHSALDLLERSELARRSFGDAIVDHYVHAGRLEVREFDAAVTDWERQRYFERI